MDPTGTVRWLTATYGNPAGTAIPVSRSSGVVCLAPQGSWRGDRTGVQQYEPGPTTELVAWIWVHDTLCDSNVHGKVQATVQKAEMGYA